MLTKNIILLFEHFFCSNFSIFSIDFIEVVSTHLGAFMDKYCLNLTWSELDSLKAAMSRTIEDLEKCHDMLNEKLDELLEPAAYAQYLECLANVSRDKANMRSILLKADLSHE